MDVVVTVDTSVAHLSGALGRPTWILLPFAPDFRWLLNRNDSPWYPTVRLFRQKRIGSWEEPLRSVGHELLKLKPD
jgi:ADP-heptose:LPS heptosyltransferase